MSVHQYNKRILCLQSLIKEKGYSPRIASPKDPYDAFFINSKKQTIILKGSVREKNIDTYQDFWMDDSYFLPLVKEWNGGKCYPGYVLFFPSGLENHYNWISFNLESRMKIWLIEDNKFVNKIPWVEKVLPTRTIDSDGQIKIKKILSLEYDMASGDQKSDKPLFVMTNPTVKKKDPDKNNPNIQLL